MTFTSTLVSSLGFQGTPLQALYQKEQQILPSLTTDEAKKAFRENNYMRFQVHYRGSKVGSCDFHRVMDIVAHIDNMDNLEVGCTMEVTERLDNPVWDYRFDPDTKKMVAGMWSWRTIFAVVG